MPIDWIPVSRDDNVGQELHDLIRELYPLPRSLTGEGVRKTLAVIGRDLPLDVVETPSGTEVLPVSVSSVSTSLMYSRASICRRAWMARPRTIASGSATLTCN